MPRRPILLALLVAVVATAGLRLARPVGRAGDRAAAPRSGSRRRPIAGTTLDGAPFDLASLRGQAGRHQLLGPALRPLPRRVPAARGEAGRARRGRADRRRRADRRPGRAGARLRRASTAATWPTVVDPDKAIKTAYRVAARPQTYFVDRTGVIRSIQVGELTDADFERQYARIALVTRGDPAVVVDGLVKRYGDADRPRRRLADGRRPGELVALLGPNGAGKTTTVEIVEGYRRRRRRTASRVLGADPATRRAGAAGAGRADAPGRRHRPARPAARDAPPVRPLPRRPARRRRAARPRRAARGRRGRATGGCPAASGSGSGSRWRSSAGPRS